MGYRQGEIRSDPTGKNGEMNWGEGGWETVCWVSFRSGEWEG